MREFVRELHAQGIAIELTDLPEWSPAKLPLEMRDPWFETLNQPCGADIVVHFSMPHQVVPHRGMFNVNFTMFEADRVPPDWIRVNRKHDLVIVPTQSSRRAWVDSGMPEHRVRICPLGVNPTLFTGHAEPLPLNLDRRVRFLNVSDLSPRKNLPALVSAWIEATSREDDAVLILKLGCRSPAERERFQQGVRDEERRLGKTLAEAAPVVFLEMVLSDADMARLFASATHYIGMSFGEGWDFPMMQAGASGLRLIAPAHSAYSAYLDSSIATLLPTCEVPVEYAGDAATAVLFKDARWWQPSRQSAIDAIRTAIQGRDAGQSFARERILREFTWERATRRLIEILEELHAVRDKLRLVAALHRNKPAPEENAHSQPAPPRDADR